MKNLYSQSDKNNHRVLTNADGVKIDKKKFVKGSKSAVIDAYPTNLSKPFFINKVS